MNITRFCPKCEKNLDLKEFGKSTNVVGGTYLCRKCETAKLKLYRLKTRKKRELEQALKKSLADTKFLQHKDLFIQLMDSNEGRVVQLPLQDLFLFQHKSYKKSANIQISLLREKDPKFVLDFGRFSPMEISFKREEKKEATDFLFEKLIELSLGIPSFVFEEMITKKRLGF